jgi:hypothetical protein
MNFFNIDVFSLNLLSIVIGLFIGSVLTWGRGLIFVCLYFVCLSVYFYISLHPIIKL